MMIWLDNKKEGWEMVAAPHVVAELVSRAVNRNKCGQGL